MGAWYPNITLGHHRNFVDGLFVCWSWEVFGCRANTTYVVPHWHIFWTIRNLEEKKGERVVGWGDKYELLKTYLNGWDRRQVPSRSIHLAPKNFIVGPGRSFSFGVRYALSHLTGITLLLVVRLCECHPGYDSPQ